MSLWACVEHGLVGPMACCGKASLASVTATNQFQQKAVGGSDVCHTCAAHCVAIEDLERDKAALEARCRVLDDALKIARKIRSKDDANRIAELEAALRKYGGHARNCAHIQGHYKGPSRDCDCDWVNAFPAAMGASTKETCALRLRTATFHKVAANQKLTVGEQSEWDGYMERLRNFVAGSKKGIDND